MKLVVGIVRPERLEAVQKALADAKVWRLTASDAQGFSPSAAQTHAGAPTSAAQAYAGGPASGTGPTVGVVRKVKLEIAVNEEFVEPTVRAIARGARTGEGAAGDGVVLVLPLEEAIRIRTGERGPEAI